VNTLLEIELHSKIRNINLEYNKLVIGSTLEALAYSYLNNIPLVCSHLNPPHRFDYFDPEDNLSVFGVKNKLGMPRFELWEKLFFYLSVGGLCPLTDKAISLRVTDNILKASTAKARMAKIHFNKLIIFDDKNVFGLGAYEIENKKFKVYDWFDVRSGMKHEHSRLEDTTDFVNHIIFYSSDRVEGEHNFKDAVAVSYLTKEQLNDFQFSDINARFKVLYMMKKAGIRGARNGRDMNDKTKYKYYAVKIENTHREVIEPRNIYESSDSITFNYDSFGDIINKTPLKESYVSRLLKRTR